MLAGSATGVRDAAYSMTRSGHLLRTQRWAYMESADGEAELYDMRADPKQFTNLVGAPEHGATVETLAGELQAKLTGLVRAR